MAGDEVPWPAPPREPGPWNGGPPLSPPGNTPLPPLPGSGGVVHGAAAQANPWSEPAASGPGVWGAPGFGPQGSMPPPPGQPGFPGLPAPPPKLVDRASAWVLALSAVVVVAVIAGGLYLGVKGGRQYPDAWDPRVDPIAAWVAEERELDFEHPVEVNFLSDGAYRARATEGGSTGSPEDDQYFADQAAQLRALGFLSGDVDLSEASDTLNDSGTLAYYDPDLEQVFVRGVELTPDVRVTLAHELTHVLQDQNFDLERIDEFEDGRGAVLRALAEGDATKVEDAFIEEGLNEADRATYLQESETGGDAATEELDAKVPPILTTLFASPYILGPRLIDYLDAVDGWEAIDEALQEPPTEEAMFDPAAYGTNDAGLHTVTVEPPAGTEVLETSTFGPTAWYLLLSARLDPKVALQATDGWGGDASVAYRKGDQVCFDAAIAADTPEDLAQLSKALTDWSAKSPKGTSSATTEGDQVRFQSCDPGKEAEAVGNKVTTDLLALPTTRTDIYTQGILADRTPAESQCFADGAIGRFTFDQLSDPKGAYIRSDAGQMILGELRAQCFK